MRVTFRRAFSVDGSNRPFQKDQVAFAEDQGDELIVLHPVNGEPCQVPLDAVTVVKFERAPFGFMANRSGADFPLSPDSVERSVERYLDRLGEALAADRYSPSPSDSVNALVFGEWGHGKSQVLYRTSSTIADKFPDALVIQVIPEELSPRGVLQAILSDVERSPRKSELDTLLEAYRHIQTVRDNEKAEQYLVETLIGFAKRADALHVCVLFDEGQTWGGMNFQRFLGVLAERFRAESRMLHTLQCHSMASLDRAREVAKDLRYLLDTAIQLHLPSIQESDAATFFRRRLEACTSNEAIARKLIPEGVAKALCRAAGGNPRRMLQYAGSVLETCDEKRRPEFDGATVLKVFGEQNDPRTGQPLFHKSAFDRIIQLLPQVYPRHGESLARFIEENIGKLLGEDWRARPLDLADALGGLNPNETSKVATCEVDGISLLTSRLEYDEEEDEEETFFFLSDEFRDRLATRTGSSGDLERKQALYRILLNAEQSQGDATAGLAAILNLERFGHQPLPVTLGERFRGMVFNVPVSGLTSGIRVLVSAVYGVNPPLDFMETIIDGLSERKWIRAIVVYFNHEESWQRFSGQPEIKSLLQKIEKSHPDALEICAPFQPDDWRRILPAVESTEQETIAVTAARVFASLVAETRTNDLPTDEERRRFFREIRTIVDRDRPSPADIVYLPDDRERALLGSEKWRCPEADAGFLVREVSDFAGHKVSRNDLESLLEDYLEKSGTGGRYVRSPPNRSRLYKEVRDGLERKKQSDVDGLIRLVEQRLLVEPRDRLHANVTWVLDALCRQGLAKHPDLRGIYSYVDLPGEKRCLEKELRRLVVRETDRNSSIHRFSPDWATQSGALAEIQTKQKQLRDYELGQQVECLKHLKQDLEAIAAEHQEIEARMVKERKAIFSHLESRYTELQARRGEVDEPWQSLAIPSRTLEDLRHQLESLEERAESPEQDLLYSLKEDSRVLERRIELAAKRLEPPDSSRSEGAASRDLLVRWIASGSAFTEIVVELEEPV